MKKRAKCWTPHTLAAKDKGSKADGESRKLHLAPWFKDLSLPAPLDRGQDEHQGVSRRLTRGRSPGMRPSGAWHHSPSCWQSRKNPAGKPPFHPPPQNKRHPRIQKQCYDLCNGLHSVSVQFKKVVALAEMEKIGGKIQIGSIYASQYWLRITFVWTGLNTSQRASPGPHKKSYLIFLSCHFLTQKLFPPSISSSVNSM